MTNVEVIIKSLLHRNMLNMIILWRKVKNIFLLNVFLELISIISKENAQIYSLFTPMKSQEVNICRLDNGIDKKIEANTEQIKEMCLFTL